MYYRHEDGVLLLAAGVSTSFLLFDDVLTEGDSLLLCFVGLPALGARVKSSLEETVEPTEKTFFTERGTGTPVDTETRAEELIDEDETKKRSEELPCNEGKVGELTSISSEEAVTGNVKGICF